MRIIQFQFLSTLHFTFYRVMEVIGYWLLAIGYWLWVIGEGLEVRGGGDDICVTSAQHVLRRWREKCSGWKFGKVGV